MMNEDIQILFYEEGVKEVETWIKNNRQMIILFGVSGIGGWTFFSLFVFLIPSWQNWYTILSLFFINISVIFLTYKALLYHLRFSLPALTGTGFLIPYRSRFGSGSDKPAERMEYFVPYEDILSASKGRGYGRNKRRFIWLKFKHPKVKQAILIQGKLIHDIDSFIEILESKGIIVTSML